MLDVGDPVPDFSLPRDGGGTAGPADFPGKTVVVYFYPKDDTSGCTKEAIGFSEKADEFEAAGAVILGVSKDSVASHDKFRDKHDLKVILLSDETGEVVEKFGVWVEKSMYGRKFMGIDRATFLVREGVIRHVWRKVKVTGHVDTVLKAVTG